jgi:HD superfamily phosphodiesterase
VLNNWEARSKYLLHDIIKYQHYCDALEKSIEKHKLQQQEQEKLVFKSSTVDLFEEINQELSLHL